VKRSASIFSTRRAGRLRRRVPRPTSGRSILRLDQVNGPIFVAGAEPGDTLEIEFLDVTTADWGWTALIPGFGLLADEFPEPALKIWSLEDGAHASTTFAPGIRIPIAPFAGRSVWHRRRAARSSPWATGMLRRATGKCAAPRSRRLQVTVRPPVAHQARSLVRKAPNLVRSGLASFCFEQAAAITRMDRAAKA